MRLRLVWAPGYRLVTRGGGGRGRVRRPSAGCPHGVGGSRPGAAARVPDGEGLPGPLSFGAGFAAARARPPCWERFRRLGAVVTEGLFGVGFGAVCVERVSGSSSLCCEGERVNLESGSGGHSGLLDPFP